LVPPRRCPISIIYLVRHGETEWNQDKRIQGQTDIPLNERGRKQAEALAERLASVPLERIYTSDLGRTCETTRAIAGRQPRNVPVVSTPELRECDYGRWEGLTRVEVARRFPDDWAEWRRRDGIGSPTGGEDFLSLAGRTGRIFDAAAGAGGPVLISTHRGPIRAILCHALGVGQAFRERFLVTNCSLSALECHPGHRTRLVLLNDTCHLEGVV
jgi:broad specificity phosphatase PhoE